MTTYTKADLASKALRLPGLYAPDESISGEDQQDAETMADSLVETLTDLSVFIPNGSVSVVPASWYIPLAQFIGLYLLQSFGGTAPTPDQIEGALRTLRSLSTKPATGAVLTNEYF